MTSRAKRLAEYLEDTLGWQVFDPERERKGCGKYDFGRSTFCPDCGGSYFKAHTSKADTLADLESALDFALNEADDE